MSAIEDEVRKAGVKLLKTKFCASGGHYVAPEKLVKGTKRPTCERCQARITEQRRRLA